MISNYKKNIYRTYFSCLFKISFVFLILIIIMNLFEEINFFKDTSNQSFFLPIYLTFLNAPSILFEIFPFIILLSCLFFFMELINKDELVIYKIYGLTNLKIIQIISYITFLVGVLVIIIFYNFSSNLKFLYLDIKNDFSKDDKYLAVVTGNGLWIRDEVNNNINFINAEKLKDDHLIKVSISQYDKEFNLKKVIIAPKAIIYNREWVLINPLININNNSEKTDKIIFYSNFDLKRILSIFENLSSLNIWELEKLKKEYELLGYNPAIINGHKHKLYSFPVYLALMSCIAAILMLNIKKNKSKITNITLGILISVIIYYINFFFGVIIETQDVPYLISIWGPQLILAMIITVNLLNINEK